ncbi:MAG: NAD-dependent malic enzyme [Bacillota bacterium]
MKLISDSSILRLKIKNRPGMLAKVTAAIGYVKGDIGSINIVSVSKDYVVRDISVFIKNEAHLEKIIKALKLLEEKGVAQLVKVYDDVRRVHEQGKITLQNKLDIRNFEDLSRVYTPGVAKICRAIVEDPSKASDYTIISSSVAIVTDGSAVLGLGNIGPLAAMPVMEGKAMLFKKFAGVNAFPLLINSQDADEIVKTVKLVAPTYGGINLEDIASPRCFEIEERLSEELDIPVFHDDQHGTAVVVLAGLINALKVVQKDIANIKVLINGTGAAGTAIARLLIEAGATDIVMCDRAGAIYRGREEHMDDHKRRLAEITNEERVKGHLSKVIGGRDVFVGVSVAGALKKEMVKRMAPDPIIFALANPIPEILPEEVEGVARVIATGRSDYTNQINNVLCFPGIFKGALSIQARKINTAMKLAAAEAIAGMISTEHLSEDYIIPSVFHPGVAEAVAENVIRAAIRTGVAPI